MNDRFYMLHAAALTPVRLMLFLGVALAIAPFSLALQLLLRRGSTLRATAAALTGRAVVMGVLLLGIATDLLPAVVTILLGPLLLVSIASEIVSTAIYARSRNAVAIAVFDASLQALWLAIAMPVRA